MFWIKPNPEKTVEDKPLQVHDPQHRDILPPEGRAVTRTPYWLRRLRDGDVIATAPPAADADADQGKSEDTATDDNGNSANDTGENTNAEAGAADANDDATDATAPPAADADAKPKKSSKKK